MDKKNERINFKIPRRQKLAPKIVAYGDFLKMYHFSFAILASLLLRRDDHVVKICLADFMLATKFKKNTGKEVRQGIGKSFNLLFCNCSILQVFDTLREVRNCFCNYNLILLRQQFIGVVL